jgi:hypothetical protein
MAETLLGNKTGMYFIELKLWPIKNGKVDVHKKQKQLPALIIQL